MEQNELMNIVAEILEVDVDSITLESDLASLGWDSLANISFIAEVDTAAEITVDGDALAEAKTVADLHALVSGA
jgi:acyl carrier protein